MLSLQERHQKILDMLNNQGEVRVNELSRIFEGSEVCIRNDLSELEGKGMLSRVHGGAVSTYEPYYNMSLRQRSNTNKEEKDKIAAKIADMIQDNQAVMMNAGTTPLAVMRKLTNKNNITIITNSIWLLKVQNIRISELFCSAERSTLNISLFTEPRRLNNLMNIMQIKLLCRQTV